MVVRRKTWAEYQEAVFTGQLRLIADFIKRTDRGLTNEWEELQTRIAEECNGMDGEEANKHFDSYADEFFDLNVHFPKLHASMTFISLYSLLEHHLTILCHRRQKECMYELAVEDLKDRGINACKTYMTKVCGLQFPSENAEWGRIKNYEAVRNVIVHRRGKLRRGKDKKVRKFLENSKTAKLETNDRLTLSFAFCVEVIRTLEDLAKLVTSSIPTCSLMRINMLLET